MQFWPVALLSAGNPYNQDIVAHWIAISDACIYLLKWLFNHWQGVRLCVFIREWNCTFKMIDMLIVNQSVFSQKILYSSAWYFNGIVFILYAEFWSLILSDCRMLVRFKLIRSLEKWYRGLASRFVRSKPDSLRENKKIVVVLSLCEVCLFGSRSPSRVYRSTSSDNLDSRMLMPWRGGEAFQFLVYFHLPRKLISRKGEYVVNVGKIVSIFAECICAFGAAISSCSMSGFTCNEQVQVWPEVVPMCKDRLIWSLIVNLSF